MSQEELLKNLRQLHVQLQENTTLDSETQAMLEAVTNDIRKLLEHRSEPQDPSVPQSVSERIRLNLIEFEARHPQLGGLLERITDGLAGMGI